MRNFLARALTLVVALGVLGLLVAHAGIAGCAASPPPADPGLANPLPAAPLPTAPVVSAAAPTPPVPPDPVIDVGTGYLPATKAAPMLWANPPPPAPPQQAAPSPRNARP
jgi:hypothetical protein